jgi:hypothetical protein
MLELHYRDSARLAKAVELLRGACPILEGLPTEALQVLEVLE